VNVLGTGAGVTRNAFLGGHGLLDLSDVDGENRNLVGDDVEVTLEPIDLTLEPIDLTLEPIDLALELVDGLLAGQGGEQLLFLSEKLLLGGQGGEPAEEILPKRRRGLLHILARGWRVLCHAYSYAKSF
jgi:hypothetical protein